jgi:hypothetical protein
MTEHIDWYALFAVPFGTVESLSETIFPSLGLEFESISSGAWGDYTISGDPDHGETVSIYANRAVDEDGEYFRARGFEEFPILVAIYNTSRLGRISKLLKDNHGAALVEHTPNRAPPPKPFR